MYLQKNAIGGFLPSDYLSSSEIDLHYAYAQTFFDGSVLSDNKAGTDYVRAIRAFQLLC